MKLCNKCNEVLPIQMFGKRGKYLQPYCKPCNKHYQQEHYQKHKQRYIAEAEQRRLNYNRKAHNFLMEYAKDGCSVCGETDYRCLEFDHVDQSTKIESISYMVGQQYPLRKIKEELNKCRVLCANCHRKHTATQMGWYKHCSSS